MTSKPTYQDLLEENNKLHQQLSNCQNNKYFKELIKNNLDAFSVIDKNGINIFQSESNATILGYTPEERKNKNAFELMVPEDRENLLNFLTKKVKDNSKIEKLHFRAYHKDGSIRYLEGTAKNMLDSPLINGIIINYRDVTEQHKYEEALKESEAKLRESNKTKDKLFSIIAHDLKNPFNTILGLSELLTKEFEDYQPDMQKHFLQIIYNEIQDTYKLLENLLNWSQTQRGCIKFIPKRENLHSLCKQAIQILDPAAEKKSILIINQIDENIYINTDKNIFSIIIRNLITNAIKFTPPKGKINIQSEIITTDENQKIVKISVIDSGVGISKETLSKLFKNSDIISTKGTQKEKGTGLGLMLCKEFVEKHGGKIWVESQEGVGSKFMFTIPIL